MILGGLHVSAVPEEAGARADAIVIGEGEPAWPRIASNLLHGADGLRPIYDARGCNFDLSESPMPRFDLLNVHNYNRLTVQTQRGCPFRCEFCAASIRISPTYKVKPVDRVLAEIRAIKSLWNRPFIEFAGDNTFVNKAHSRQLMRLLAHEDVRWFTETDLSVADDPVLLAMMRDAGCAEVLIGFESTSFSGLDGLEQRSNWKARHLDHYLGAVRTIQDHGIRVNGCFILGLDGTGPDSFDAIARFIQQSGLFDVQITVQTAFPGTPLYARLKDEGRIVHDQAWELCTLFDVNFQPKQMTVAELERGLRTLASQIYSEEATLARRENFRRNLHEQHRIESQQGSAVH